MSSLKIKNEDTHEFSSFIEELNDENATTIMMVEEDEEDDDDDDCGTYFVDQAGNYYYQATKDSEPVPTEPPEGIMENDGEMEQYEILDDEDDLKEKSNISEQQGENEYSYVVLMEEKKNDVKTDENLYEFEENEDISEEKLKSKTTKHYDVKLVQKNVSGKSDQNICKADIHACNYCNYSSSKRYLLARHMKSHSDERPYKCSVCERGFKTSASLVNHLNTHTGNKPHSCKYCSSSFTTSGELVRHVRYRHTHEKPHKCTECDYASVELSKLKRHIRCHTGERPFQCPHCTYASPDTFKLKRHLRIHTGEKPYECDICHARFTQSNSLKAHKLIHNVGEKPVFQCELCPTTCGRKTDLRIHVQKLHTSEKPIPCKRCGNDFPDRYTYKLHLKTHEGEKCYKCALCPYASISQRHLEAHQLIHTDEKPFECDFCEQAFRQKQLLKRHINFYHNANYIPPEPKPKIHNCPDCQRSFSHKGNLIRHMAMHDPDSKIEEEKKKLRRGRKKKVKVIEGQLVAIVPGDDDSVEDQEELFEDEEYEMELEESTGTIKIKNEEDNDYSKVDNQEYLVLEVIQCEEEEEISEENSNEQLVINKNPKITKQVKNRRVLSKVSIKSDEHDKSGDVLNFVSKKKKPTINMQDCFGFEDDVSSGDYKEEIFS